MLKQCEKLALGDKTPKELKKKLEQYQERLAELQRESHRFLSSA